MMKNGRVILPLYDKKDDIVSFFVVGRSGEGASKMEVYKCEKVTDLETLADILKETSIDLEEGVMIGDGVGASSDSPGVIKSGIAGKD